MELRLDLLEHLADEDILEEVLASNHRYKPEPNFSKTGVGYLRPATPEERAQKSGRNRKLDDGRLAWRADGTGSELISLPEALLLERKPPPEQWSNVNHK